MAMQVKNNMGAVRTLNTLNKNSKAMAKSLAKVSSGMKITSAEDDSSAYAISERMRAQIRGLDQDTENVKNGRSLLKVATGGIENIIDELRNLKELALNAANDHNTDLDRATIQKEFDQRMANIDDIASETNYNGKILLDGRYGNGKVAPRLVTDFHVYLDEPRGTARTISAGAGDITISDGVWEIAAGYTGTITIADGAEDVLLKQADPSVELNEVFIEGPSTGYANLWIDSLNIKNMTDKNIIKFQGNDNVLTLRGTNTLQFGDITVLGSWPTNSALINVGGGLTIEAEDDGVINLNVKGSGTGTGGSGAVIGSDRGEASTADITINGGTINIDARLNYSATTSGTGCTTGAGIGSGDGGSIGNIYINNAVIDVKAGHGACIGSSRGGTAGNIVIDNYAEVSVKSIYFGSGIGSGYGPSSSTGDITIGNATVSADAWFGAGIGSGAYGSRVGDIAIYSGANITSVSERGAGIGSGANSFAGDIILSRYADIDAESDRGDDIGAGLGGTAGAVCYMGTFNPLIIHHGTKANQALKCYINDMRTDALGLSNTKVSSQYDAMWALSDDTHNPPRIGAIDAAIEYALDEATNIGAYTSRLEFTEGNLVTASENVQSSESTIRDADMAKEMTAYTKHNVLTQSAQSMLAQANQNASSVLSLLQ